MKRLHTIFYNKYVINFFLNVLKQFLHIVRKISLILNYKNRIVCYDNRNKKKFQQKMLIILYKLI